MIGAAATFFLLLPCLATAIPINPDSVDSSISRASVLLCTDINYTGICTPYPTLLGNNNCNSIDGDSITVKSIQTDNGLDCIFYSNGVCRTFLDPSTESLTVRSPGNVDLPATSDWIQPLLSYTCVSVKATEFADDRQLLDGENRKEGMPGIPASPIAAGEFEGVEVGVWSR